MILPGMNSRPRSFAASASSQLNVVVKGRTSKFGSSSSRSHGSSNYGAGDPDRLLRHYQSAQINTVSWKERKSKRGTLSVSEAEVQAAMPKTRLQLREKMMNDGVITRDRTTADLRSSSSRYKAPTQVGSNLKSVETNSNRPGTSVPSYMSDKQLQRIADDPVRSMKYGSQLASFGSELNKRVEKEMSRTTFVENHNLDRLQRIRSNFRIYILLQLQINFSFPILFKTNEQL